MTIMLSFRVDDALARQLDREADLDDTSRSAILAAALRAELYRRACERDAAIYDLHPLTDDELVAPTAQSWSDAPEESSW